MAQLKAETTLFIGLGFFFAVAGLIFVGILLSRSRQEKQQLEFTVAERIAKLQKRHELQEIERKNYEALARWHKSIVNAMPFPIAIMDANTSLTFVNTAMENLWGMKLGDKLGMPCCNWNAKVCNTDDCGMNRAKRGEKRTVFAYDNATYQVDVEILRDLRGEIVGFVELVQDVSREVLAGSVIEELAKRQADAEAASIAKSTFLANMSHEIRTPMHAILGMAELALREDVTLAAQEHIHTIKNAGTNLLSIINDILDFSKIETGKLEIVPNEYLFSSLVLDVITIIKQKVFESYLRFVVNIDSNLPNILFGDAVRIRQILLNLLSNSVKYTQQGFVALNITGEIADNNIVILTIIVSDSGKGIKQEDIKKLFTEFTRFDIMNNAGIEGTGLGLAITHSLVKAMGGKIEVISIYGAGSTFTVTLPQQIISSQKLAVVENPKEKNILLYERRDICRDSMMGTMESLGVNYKIVSSDQEFYDEIMSRQYSFAFVAIILYENLIESYTDIRSSNAKIILISEFGETSSAKNRSIITAPLFSIPVANCLNAVPEGYSRSMSYGSSIVSFTAPTARVLIADDTATNLRVAIGLLEPYNMQIDWCKNGIEAVEAVKSARYDMVFMDHMMPEMDGIEATEHIRALGDADPYYKDLPIVALTANAVFGAKEMFLHKGFNDFLPKPIDLYMLDLILARWIPNDKQESIRIERHIEAATNVRIAIDGLNVENGLALAQGSMRNYLGTLAVFYKEGFEKIREIKACLKTGNLRLYTIYVHALKGATAYIGANSLAEAAQSLEAAGKKGDMLFIEARNAAFVAELETLLSNIQAVISQISAEEQQAFTDMELLKSELSELRAALKAFDPIMIKQTVDSLQKFTRTAAVGATIEDILYNVLIGDHDEAIVLIDTLEAIS